MADKSLSLTVGEITSIQIKPTFEGVAVPSNKITFDAAASDLKGLVTVNAFVPGSEGIVNVPLYGDAPGVQDVTVVFKYADAGANANVEGWGKSTKTLALTVLAAIEAALENVSTPLTMDLWESKALTFDVTKGGTDIRATVTSVTVDPASIADKFEFTGTLEDNDFAFKSIQSSSTEVTTATAKLRVVGTADNVGYDLTADVVLNTNINDGSIPTNRFDVEIQ